MRGMIVAIVAGALAGGVWFTAPPAGAQTSTPAASQSAKKKASAGKHRLRGNALWYGGERFNGRPTASGEVFDESKMTAAHRTLPFGTNVRVTNLRNNRTAVVTINDRMARRRTVIIDLSRGAAAELDMINSGRVPVRLEILR